LEDGLCFTCGKLDCSGSYQTDGSYGLLFTLLASSCAMLLMTFAI
jgi:hypothetical protein